MNIVLYIAIVLAFGFFIFVLKLDISDIRKKSIYHLPEDPLSASERRQKRKQLERVPQKSKPSSRPVKKRPVQKKKRTIQKKATNKSKKPAKPKPPQNVASYEKAKLKYRKKR